MILHIWKADSGWVKLRGLSTQVQLNIIYVSIFNANPIQSKKIYLQESNSHVKLGLNPALVGAYLSYFSEASQSATINELLETIADANQLRRSKFFLAYYTLSFFKRGKSNTQLRVLQVFSQEISTFFFF